MVNLNDPRNATSRGWGPMWSPGTSPRNDMIPLAVGDGTFGNVHPGLHDLMELLLDESLDRGYKIHKPPQQCWGFAWRAIRGTSTPSNHSAGTAIDINSLYNWLGRSDGGDVPKWMVSLWNNYGFRWGGDYSGRQDPMHWEFMGDRSDAKTLTDKARKEFTDVALTDAQKEALQFTMGERLFLDGREEPTDPGPRRQGWRIAKMNRDTADAVAALASQGE